MARSCPICRRKDLDSINIDILDGIGTQVIAEKYGATRAELDYHRKSGHASRALTKMVLDAHNGPLSDFAQISIASKLERVKKLAALLDRVEGEINSQKIGELDHRLVKENISILTTAAKEMGEWKPDGGDKAEATRQLAQSIVIHAAVAAQGLTEAEQALTIDAAHVEVEDG